MSGPRRTTLTIGSIALVATLLASGCSKQVEADCQPVGEDLRWLFERESQSPLQEIYAVPSRTDDGGWFMAADTRQGIAVWASSIPPDAEGVGIVFPANEAAHADAVLDEGVADESSTISPLLADRAGIAAAERCVESG